MSNTHCGKDNKLSKTIGSPLDSMKEIVSSQCPYGESMLSYELSLCFQSDHLELHSKIWLLVAN